MKISIYIYKCVNVAIHIKTIVSVTYAMGNVISQYNPFSVYGEYNLKKHAYENKKSVIGTLSFILLLTIGAIIMLWVTGNEPTPATRTFNIPPPKYGLGPYGYGLYIPPVNMMS